MEQEKEFTGQESLELISRMITKARKDYYDTGLSALLWGSTITICSLVSFTSFFLKMPELLYVWFLTIVAVIPQVIISIREKKSRLIKGMMKIYERHLDQLCRLHVPSCWVIGWLNLPHMGIHLYDHLWYSDLYHRLRPPL